MRLPIPLTTTTLLPLLLAITTMHLPQTQACTPPPDPTAEYLLTRAPCTTDATCPPHEFCFHPANRCLPRLSAGTCCATDTECSTNYCQTGSCALSQTGKPCTTVSDCSTGTTSGQQRWCGFGLCAAGICARPGGEYGAVCQRTEECVAGLVCAYSLFSEDRSTKICQAAPGPGAYGAACAGDADCVSGNCGVNGELVCGEPRLG
ncbi:hypothetical protein ASPACDRAFT_42329 [Aspergillus aculeatus ATCC 16872]|uniref:Dickkopf N-terminal cysteine-rich domain-containing protein n=1 Tax=Aspergillus aculeatus (strain ATCC 16872 / CBS 172.66 / WB 5094) TaxID=690307 RepID=A0A1L9WXE2_ASPA1|nr:uncharacterized protein ASPACDRAFT_42329 [Aspergillus aculeatus ATCC 16872]OJK00834.1 hypothetical protein ASPACDRAFT_42329 [Aspergillus aculeatus ATCC 16872]